MKEELVNKAVDWWADRLVSCKQSGLSAEERRDPSNLGYQLGGEMVMAVHKPKVSPEKIFKFKESLREVIEDNNPRYLSVDYQPDGLLEIALRKAEIPDGSLPIKTDMWLDDTVRVSYGYGAEIVTL